MGGGGGEHKDDRDCSKRTGLFTRMPSASPVDVIFNYSCSLSFNMSILLRQKRADRAQGQGHVLEFEGCIPEENSPSLFQQPPMAPHPGMSLHDILSILVRLLCATALLYVDDTVVSPL